MTELIMSNGTPIREAMKARADPEGKGKIVGLSPWREQAVYGPGIKGAATKKGSWRDYYDMYKSHSWVRATIDKIATTATDVGYDFVPRDSRAKLRPRELKKLQEFFNNQPKFVMELRKIYKDLLIYGDGYMYVVPTRRRQPYKLKRLHPRTIHIKTQSNGEIINYYQKDPDNILDEPVSFEPHEILHFRVDDPDNDIYGLSPLESLKYAVAADLYAQRYNASFFANSGVTGTIIGIRNANPDEVQRNRKWLEENYMGPEAAHKPIVIEGESVTIEKSVATHQEMGFLEGRRFIIMEILAVLGVPPAKIGIMESANRSNSKEQDKTFRTEAVSALQNLVELTVNDDFIRPTLGVENTIFVHSEGDTRDAIEQMDYFTKGQAWGIFNPNEVRAKLGMAPVEGGDINGIMSPTGFVPLDRLTLYFAPMEVPANAVPSKDDPIEGEPVPQSTVNTGPGAAPRIAKSATKGKHDNLEYIRQLEHQLIIYQELLRQERHTVDDEEDDEYE
jgi:HK97 family phage portal protein